MKTIFGIIFGFIIFIIILYWFVIGFAVKIVADAISDETENVKAIKEVLIGEKVIINNDTLVITEFIYDPINGNKLKGIFSDGATLSVDINFVKKNLIK
jgi:hypothetical protein